MLKDTSPRKLILLGGFAVVLYMSFRILQPFLPSIFLALILATLLAPANEFLLRRLGGRRTLAALTVCLGLTVGIFLPVLFLLMSLGREANEIYTAFRNPEIFEGVSTWLEEQRPWLMRIEEWVTLPEINATALQEQIREFALPALGGLAAFLAGILTFFVNYSIMLVVLFFMLRDTVRFEERLRGFSPLDRQDEHLFVERFRAVTRASVIGNGLTSVAQGSAMALLFWGLGIPNVVLWGALGALFSLVPFVGMALIWAPWAVYFFATGEVVKGVILVAVQTLIVGSMDNVLRPMLIESGVKMHTLLVFFSILGGIRYFGMLGILFGPLIFALTLTCLDFYFGSSEKDAAAEEPAPVP